MMKQHFAAIWQQNNLCVTLPHRSISLKPYNLLMPNTQIWLSEYNNIKDVKLILLLRKNDEVTMWQKTYILGGDNDK